MKILSRSELEIVAAELRPLNRAIPEFAAGTGLGLRNGLPLSAVTSTASGESSAFSASTRTGSSRSTRRHAAHGAGCRSVGECSAHVGVPPARLDTPLLFPGARGSHLDLHNFRERHWKPALRAAGLEYRRPYDLRHTYATFSIAGVSLFALARRMGTSLEMIDTMYGHLSPDGDEYELGLLDAFDARVSKAEAHFLDAAG